MLGYLTDRGSNAIPIKKRTYRMKLRVYQSTIAPYNYMVCMDRADHDRHIAYFYMTIEEVAACYVLGGIFFDERGVRYREAMKKEE